MEINVGNLETLKARQVFDSRGKPTVEAEVELRGTKICAAVPSGASTGLHEATELRDNVQAEYNGHGTPPSIYRMKDIKDALLASKDAFDQNALDKFLSNLDGTDNKSRLGANAILAVSLVFARMGSFLSVRDALILQGESLYSYLSKLAGRQSHMCVPMPCFNVINGGSHSGSALPFQELMVVPTEAKSFSDAMRFGAEIYASLKSVIGKKYGKFGMNAHANPPCVATNVGDEGGFAPNISTIYEGLDILVEAAKIAGYEGRISIAIDAAASGRRVYAVRLEFYDAKSGNYNLGFKTDTLQLVTPVQLLDMYLDIAQKYPSTAAWIAASVVVSIEDPFDQDDWTHWSLLTSRATFQVVADDLTVTNPRRIRKAIDCKACTALLLKVNQIGTVSESIQAASMAFDAGWNVMVSHRSGETEDTFIADLAVALGSKQIKAGAPCRSERVCKYNRLLRYVQAGAFYRIEEELGDSRFIKPVYHERK